MVRKEIVEVETLRCVAEEREGLHFNELDRRLRTKIQLGSYSTLSNALKELVKRGFVKRRMVKSGGIPKTVYSITDLGLTELKSKRNSKVDVNQSESRHAKTTLSFPNPKEKPRRNISVKSPVQLGGGIYRFPFATVEPQVILRLDRKNRKHAKSIFEKLKVEALSESIVRAIWETIYESDRKRRVPQSLSEFYSWGVKGLDVDATLIIHFDGRRTLQTANVSKLLEKSKAYTNNLEVELSKWQKLAVDDSKRRLIAEMLLAYLLTSEKLHLAKDLIFYLGMFWTAAELPNPPDLTLIQDILSGWRRNRLIGVGYAIKVLKMEQLKKRQVDSDRLIECILYHSLPNPWGGKGSFSDWFTTMQAKVRAEGTDQIPAKLRAELQRQIRE